MNSSKQLICTERLRRLPAQFSWVDQRLVQDRHLDQVDTYAAALYLFLITVADARGLSWYGDTSTARRLSIDEADLRRARGDLVRAGLLAYAGGLYQVLALDDPLPPPPTSRHEEAVSEPSSVPAALPATKRTGVREHLAALHAALGRGS
jgi:hypothetical protein